MSYLLNATCIVACGLGGALAGWLVVSWIEWTGTAAAIAMAAIGMVVATTLFVLGVVVGKALRIIRT